jgi:hypothetical protein
MPVDSPLTKDEWLAEFVNVAVGKRLSGKKEVRSVGSNPRGVRQMDILRSTGPDRSGGAGAIVYVERLGEMIAACGEQGLCIFGRTRTWHL